MIDALRGARPLLAGGLVSLAVFAAVSVALAQAPDFDWWRGERAKRQAAIDAYLAANQKGFLSFKNAALSSKEGVFNLVGVPMVMFRLMPEIFPDIWGPSEEKMLRLGLGPDPWEPDRLLPLGVGYLPSKGFTIPIVGDNLNVNYATLTCAACHAGPVVGPDGKLARELGAPTTTAGSFFGVVNAMVNDPRYSVESFKKALATKPAGWIYGDPAMAKQEEFERGLFESTISAEFFLEELKLFGNGFKKRFEETLGVYTYAVHGAPALSAGPPGSIDVFSALAASRADPKKMSATEMKAAMPQLPAPADIMAVWKQSDRAGSQWDNSFTLTVYREAAASMTVAGGDPTSINLDNVSLASAFVQDLPPAPYPFDVDATKANRGEAIFAAACAGCHKPDNPLVWPPDAVGTDPNRAFVVNDFVLTNLTQMLREGCTIAECYGPDKAALPDIQIMKMPGGYAAIPLNGIWASAPYLHNGSVPTLRHLLAGSRPATFYRGNTTYDQAMVGFTWDKAVDPTAHQLDTALVGFSNAGHSGPEFNGGIDWSAEPGKLDDLIEYLKTL